MLRIPTDGARGPHVVALGGGHGLSATLRALRRVTDRVTAVVGVADDGGSSGRLRDELGVLPPGDLRMALAALCGDDTWGRTWSRVIQHRFGGDGELAGHSLGNLLIAALWEETADPIEGLDWVAALLGAHGRVLPCSEQPLHIVAEVAEIGTVRGQVEIATTPGRVERVWLEPDDPVAPTDVIEAISNAHTIVMGPGSWFTSVIPHVLIPNLLDALVETKARRVLLLNIDPDPETEGYDVAEHIRLLSAHAPDLTFDAVLADERVVHDQAAVIRAAQSVGAELVINRIAFADRDRAGLHDPDLLASALGPLIDHGRMSQWP